MKLTTLICFLLFITSISVAQDKIARDYGRPPLVPGISELKIGDQVPDILIDNIINNDKGSIRTSDYKDKLLILDFWDTYCTVCIASMPKLDSLQKVFGNQIKLLSVTYQPEEMITKFFKTNRFLNERTPPVHRASVVDDRSLRSYFRYETNPHVVWINKGKVVAITGSVYITGENIQTLLDGKPVDWLVKTEHFDSTLPFTTINNLWLDAAQSNFYSYSILTGQATSVPQEGGIHFIQDTVQDHTRVAILNQDIYSAYQMLLFNIDSVPKKYIPHRARIVMEVKDPSRYFYKAEYGNYSDWKEKNSICYEMVKHGLVDKTVMTKLAIQDLNHRLGINGRYETRKVKCLVFVKTDRPITDTLDREKGGMAISSLIILSLDMSGKYGPAINESGFLGGLNLEPTDGTLAGFRKEIQRHGLDLIDVERDIEVIVITDAKL